jgi:hypothetical protein
MKKTVLSLALLPALLFAEADYRGVLDPHLSPYVGAEDLLTLHRTLDLTESYFQKAPPRKAWAPAFGRLLNLALIWNPINYMIMVTQHELFGHGYRIRDLGSTYATVNGYKMGTPPPYGTGGGATYFMISSNMSTGQEMAIDTAGVEATAILANRLKFKWLEDGKIDGKKASLYINSQQDITEYVLNLDTLHEHLDFENGNDMESYLFWLNLTYPGYSLTKKELKRNVLVNFLDPFTYYSIYAWLRYVVCGKSFAFPMIPIKGVRYLPSVRMGLTPFGPEYFLENYLLYSSNWPLYIYFKAGRFADNTYVGLGVEQEKVWQWDKTSLGFRADFWRQPVFLPNKKVLSLLNILDERNRRESAGEQIEGFTEEEVQFFNPHNEHKMHLGMAFSFIGMRTIGRTDAALFVELGFKTNGFLPGQSLTGAGILRAGLSTKF